MLIYDPKDSGYIPAAVDVDVPPLFWQATVFRVLYRKNGKDSLCSHRCPSVKGKSEDQFSIARCCNRTVQGSGYDVNTEIFFRRKNTWTILMHSGQAD